jgi:enterochelin esterase family protein
MSNFNRTPLLGLSLVMLLAVATSAQQAEKPTPPPLPQFKPSPNDSLISPEVQNDRHVTFHLYAPQAKSVKIRGEWVTDFPAALQGTDLEREANGAWSATIGPLTPGIYRYSYLVDEMQVADPRNPSSSQSLSFVHSMVAVPGLDYQDVQDVPHGAVQTVWYQSKALGRVRRMHVYTPPGYEKNRDSYPVLYLLHGAADSDDSWSTVGHAGFILDNLLAAKQAMPMIVVMPAGHTTSVFIWGDPRGLDLSDFEKDFMQDVLPYVETHYRVLADRQHRAIAGLSMGGMHSLDLSMANPDEFAYVGVFSSGWLAGRLEEAEKTYANGLDDAKARRGLRLLWLATGKEDFLLDRSHATIDLLKRHGFSPEFHESSGGHTWVNWRAYLHEFAPRLFH